MQHSVKLHDGYIPGIDGLRAIAVLAVIIYHANPSLLGGGFSGVDVFFVISGYVISSSLAQSDCTTFFRFAVNFYARRFLRIMPALLICLLIVSVASTLFIPHSWLSESIGVTGIAAFFGVSNLALAIFSDGYFSPREEFNPFVHTWSLGLEEQFYFFFPFILYIWMKRGEQQKLLFRVAELLLPCLLAASLLYTAMATSKQPSAAYYLLQSRFWELSSGALLFRLHHGNRLIPRSDAQAVIYLLSGLALVMVGFVFTTKRLFPFPCALLSVIGTALMICGTLVDQRRKNLVVSLLESRPVLFCGRISYSLYLWHWPVLVLGRWTLGLENGLELFAALTLTTLLATLSYRYIESPCRQAGFIRLMPKTRVIFASLVLVGLASLVAATVFLNQALVSLSVTSDRRVWYPVNPGEVVGLRTLPGKILRLLSGRNDNRQLIVSPQNGNRTGVSRKKMFVLGDSHAITYSTMLASLSEECGVDVYLYTRGGYSAANLLFPTMREGTASGEYFRSALQEIYSLAKPGDIVFIASLRMVRLCNQWETVDISAIKATGTENSARENRLLALQETSVLLEALEGKSLRVIIDAPKPVFKAPLFRCSDWFNANNPICSAGFNVDRAILLELRKPVMESLRILQNRHKCLTVWDPLTVLCPTETCSAYDSDGPLFFDGDHLTAHGNRKLYPSFSATVHNVWQ